MFVLFRVLSKDEVVIEGLSSGKDAPLEVQEGIAGRGVFAKDFIKKGAWLCEYKTTRIPTSLEEASGEAVR